MRERRGTLHFQNQTALPKKINGKKPECVEKKSIDEIATIRVLTNKPFIRIL
jgi:hypothetical protein